MYQLNESDKRPLYQQIVDQTIAGLIKGIYQEGDKLPSVRELAKLLLVNQSTIVKAYKELEEMGIIASQVGSGTYIELDQDKLGQVRRDFLLGLEDLMGEAIFLGVSRQEIIQVYENIESKVKK